MNIKDRLREPPTELWVVLDGDNDPNFSSTDKQTTMLHASIMAGDFPEHGPWRTCKYVAEPFGKIERLESEVAILRSAYNATLESAEKLKVDLAKAREDALAKCVAACDGEQTHHKTEVWFLIEADSPAIYMAPTHYITASAWDAHPLGDKDKWGIGDITSMTRSAKSDEQFDDAGSGGELRLCEYHVLETKLLRKNF